MRNIWIVAVALVGALSMGAFCPGAAGSRRVRSHRLYPFGIHHPGGPGRRGPGRSARAGAERARWPCRRAQGANVYQALMATAQNNPEVRKATQQEGTANGAGSTATGRSTLCRPATSSSQYDLQAEHRLRRPARRARPRSAPGGRAQAGAGRRGAAGAEKGNHGQPGLDRAVRIQQRAAHARGARAARQRDRPQADEHRDVRYLQVYGHTDRLGSVDHNRQLSEKRAEAVRDYLVAKGVNAEKIEVSGFGQTMPIRSCADSGRLRRASPDRMPRAEPQGGDGDQGRAALVTSPRRTCRRRRSSACGCSRAAIRRNRA